MSYEFASLLAIYLFTLFSLRSLSHSLALITKCLINNFINKIYSTRNICNNHSGYIVGISLYLIRKWGNCSLKCYKPFIWWGGIYCRSLERTILRSHSEFSFEVYASKLPSSFTSKQTRYYFIGFIL